MRRTLLLGAAIGAAAWCSPALAPVAAPVARALGLPRRIEDDAVVALTFDDGPHPEGTPAALRVLEQTGARGTFFLVGEQVDRYPALAREISEAGHTIALHGHRHRNALRLTPRSFEEDLDRGFASIADATGVQPEFHRPPYGVYSAAAIGAVRRRGLRPLLWSHWGHDWRRRATAEGIAAELTEGLRGGDVLLLHDADHYNAGGSWRNTAQALPRVLDAIERAGLEAGAI